MAIFETIEGFVASPSGGKKDNGRGKVFMPEDLNEINWVNCRRHEWEKILTIFERKYKREWV